MHVMLGVYATRAELVVEKGDAQSFRTADLFQGRSGPRLRFDHVREQHQPDGDHLAILAQSRDGLVQKSFLLRCGFRWVLGKRAEGTAKLCQDLARVPWIEEIDGGKILAFEDRDFKFVHEAGDSHAEIVADKDETLDTLAVALPQGFDQF